MKLNTIHLIFFSLLIVVACQNSNETESSSELPLTSPNIIYILADDLGYGDLSCYGQTRFATPKIDQLASQGMLFTQHYSGSTVCAPSRSALMTGLHTGHTFIRGNKEVLPEGQHPIPDSTYTLAEMLKKAGYSTGAFGKWGLGFPDSEGDPMNQGFDRFFGYNCQRLGHHYYPYHLWDNRDSLPLTKNFGIEKGTYAPELIHEQTLAFIEENKDQPFFLYVPSIIPHAELAAPEQVMKEFRGKYDPEKAYEGTDEGEKYRQGPYESQEETHAAFVAMITILDRQVGEIVAKLEELGLTENTLVVFTSDNGPHEEGGADPKYFDSNGALKGVKRDLYEGGIRVPMIVKWPGKIQEGSQTDHISAFWDVFPTLSDIVGQPSNSSLDGISFLPTLTNTQQKKHDYLYWEFHERGGRQAIRKDKWKAVKYDVFAEPDADPELYNLEEDTEEENNVASEHPEIIAEMNSIFVKARTDSEIFRFGQKGYLQKE